jgi:stearoyl-CoA desaturase (delta-9 desaturase)
MTRASTLDEERSVETDEAARSVEAAAADPWVDATVAPPRTPDGAGLMVLKALPMLGVHAACLLALWVPFSWGLVALAVGLYYLRMFGLTAGYHRYFSHRSFKTGRVVQFALAWLGAMCLQKGVLWWAANHRAHHRFSDTEKDLHSPTIRGFLWAHIGWLLETSYERTDWDRIRDFTKYPEIRWLERNWLVPPLVLFASLLLLGGIPALVWGGFVSTTLLWHGTFTINSLAHLFGSVRYRTADTSKNNFWLALITMGEGWHNNHHYYQASAAQGFFWWEIDASYYVIRALEACGIVWDVKRPSKALLEGARGKG